MKPKAKILYYCCIIAGVVVVGVSISGPFVPGLIFIGIALFVYGIVGSRKISKILNLVCAYCGHTAPNNKELFKHKITCEKRKR